MTARLILVRHGEAEGNSSHRLIGQSNVPLTDLGESQAQLVAARLGGAVVDRVVASDLDRAADTVRPIAEKAGVEMTLDMRLREIDNGAWGGLLPAEIAEGWPELWAAYGSGSDVARPDGEKWSDVTERVIESLAELLDAGGTTVIGTHGGPIAIAAYWTSATTHTGNIFRGRFGAVGNASITIIGTGPRLLTYNDIGHLEATPDERLPFDPV